MSYPFRSDPQGATGKTIYPQSSSQKKTPAQVRSMKLADDRRKQDFWVKHKYRNTLPDIPYGPKHILMPIDPSHFELSEKELKPFYDQHCDWNCGISRVAIDLRGSTKKKGGVGVELDPRDKLLLEDEPVQQKDEEQKRKMTHRRKVAWLRCPEYTSSETAKFQSKVGDKLEYRMERAIKKKISSDPNSKWEELDHLQDRKARVQGIEKTFADAERPILAHYSKPNVYAEEIMPIYPDFNMWKYNYVDVVFDTSPSASTNLKHITEEQMKKSLLHVMESATDGDDKDIERIGYFVPVNSWDADYKVEKADTEEYLLARDYSFKMTSSKSLTSVADTYAFIERDGTLSYCRIDKKINLNRFIKLDSQSVFRNTKLNVTYRELNETEIKLLVEREKMLCPEDALPAAPESDSCTLPTTSTHQSVKMPESSEPEHLMEDLSLH